MLDRPTEFIFDGSAPWSTAHALSVATDKGITLEDLSATIDALEEAIKPAPRQWVGDRLTALFALFSINRNAPDAKDLAIWLTETAALLSDIPHDILADAIDTAIKTRTHGFMPSVGEIRTIADPVTQQRGNLLFRAALVGAEMAKRENEAAARAMPSNVEHKL